MTDSKERSFSPTQQAYLLSQVDVCRACEWMTIADAFKPLPSNVGKLAFFRYDNYLRDNGWMLRSAKGVAYWSRPCVLCAPNVPKDKPRGGWWRLLARLVDAV